MILVKMTHTTGEVWPPALVSVIRSTFPGLQLGASVKPRIEGGNHIHDLYFLIAVDEFVTIEQ
jgi:hypothetical protein